MGRNAALRRFSVPFAAGSAEARNLTSANDTFPHSSPTRTEARSLICGVWDWDVLNDTVYGDEYCARIFGLDRLSTAKGRPIAEFLRGIHRDDLAKLSQAIDETMMHGGSFECEYRLCVGDTIRWVFARGSCTKDDTGRAIRFAGAIIDINDDKIAN